MPGAAAGTWDQLLSVTQAKLGAQTAERRKLPLAQVVPNPDQPRRLFEAEPLAELVASISVHGILQPILVRPHPQEPGRFQIVAGERRYQAAKQVGLKEIPAVVRELSDGEALELALVENVLREDITALEEARSLKRLIDTFGYSYAQLGERLGKNKAYVDHRVRLLKMPAEIQEALERPASESADGKLKRPFSPRHAGVVAQVKDEQLRRCLIETIFEEQLSVAEATRRKNLLEQVQGTVPKSDQRAKLEDAVIAGLSDRDCKLRLAAYQAPARVTMSGEQLPSGRPVPRVAVDDLAIYRLIAEAQHGDGAEWATKLLWALNSDRKKLRALLLEADSLVNDATLREGA